MTRPAGRPGGGPITVECRHNGCDNTLDVANAVHREAFAAGWARNRSADRVESWSCPTHKGRRAR